MFADISRKLLRCTWHAIPIRFVLSLRQSMPELAWEAIARVAWGFFWHGERLLQLFESGQRPPVLHGSERTTLTERICSHGQVGSILEVGSAYGQSFHTLSVVLPETKFYGIEKNPHYIKISEEVLRERQIDNVKLYACDAVDLGVFSNKSFDVVFSSAALLYVKPAQIRRVLEEMIRVCRGRIVLLELQAENPYFAGQAFGSYVLREGYLRGGFWLRDYTKLFEQLLPGAEVKFTKIANSLWVDEPWKQYGYVIEVTVSGSSTKRSSV